MAIIRGDGRNKYYKIANKTLTFPFECIVFKHYVIIYRYAGKCTKVFFRSLNTSGITNSKTPFAGNMIFSTQVEQ